MDELGDGYVTKQSEPRPFLGEIVNAEKPKFRKSRWSMPLVRPPLPLPPRQKRYRHHPTVYIIHTTQTNI